MRAAFKEWAAVCRALASGRQDVILRKGGIVEPGGEFRLESREFLLLPTFLHQSAEQLIPEARDLLVGIDADRPPPGRIVLTHLARVRDAVRIAAATFGPTRWWPSGSTAGRTSSTCWRWPSARCPSR